MIDFEVTGYLFAAHDSKKTETGHGLEQVSRS